MLSATEPVPIVRRAVLDDSLAIAAVHVQAWRESYAGIFPAPVLDALRVEDRESAWRDSLAKPEVAAWVVPYGEGLVGFASAGPTRDPADGDGTAELYALYLLERLWGVGLGRRLMSVVLSELRTREFHRAVLWVLEDNHRARRFYEAGGWIADGGRKDRFGGQREEAIRYGRRLGLAGSSRSSPTEASRA
jgi:GNAT superfamily N-acetyltransferase